MDNDGIFDPADGDSLAVADLTTDGKYDPVELKKGVIEINDIFSSQNRYSGKLVLRPLQKLKIVASISKAFVKNGLILFSMAIKNPSCTQIIS